TVDRATDGTDGVCQANRPSHGTCNLRAAVAAALASPGPVGITLAVDPQISAGEIALLAPAQSRAPAIAIEGGGKTITGSNDSRLFDVGAGVDLALARVTITAFTAFEGGALFNRGTLRVVGGAIGHCTFADNTASSSASAPPSNTGNATSEGGAIASFGGSIVLPRNACVFRNNHAAVDPDVHIE